MNSLNSRVSNCEEHDRQDDQCEGIVFNIQRFTVHDGPGIRTEIFLKGCPLRCKWCSNPESYSPKQEIGVYPTRCIGIDKCGLCHIACPKVSDQVFLIKDNKVVGINREGCTNCLKCHQVCPSDALRLWGRKYTVEEVMDVVLSDRSFYDKSGGGVTISGGEALLQWRFTQKILENCKEQGIHTCVETALHIKPQVIDQIAQFTDLFITDIKLIDSGAHKKYTGVGNERILENLIRIAKLNKPIILRLPIIPDVNDNFEFIDKVSDFINVRLQNSIVQVQLLRFRQLGEEKYNSLGIPYLMGGVAQKREEFEKRIKELVRRMQGCGIPAVAGSTNKIQI